MAYMISCDTYHKGEGNCVAPSAPEAFTAEDCIILYVSKTELVITVTLQSAAANL